jgi:hypothetical protein
MRTAPWLSLTTLLAVLAGSWLLSPYRQPAPSWEITGQVADGPTPLAGARVCLRGGPVTVTDRRGHFRLTGSGSLSRRLVVAREGYLVQTFPGERLSPPLQLSRLPAEDNPAYSWVEPGPRPAGEQNCINCHRAMYREWQASAHARSATNVHFLNLYDGTDVHGRPGVGWNLRRDNRDGAAVCSACHAPSVSAEQPALGDIRRAQGVDRRGVHCDFCHKISAAGTDVRGLTFGRFGYQFVRPAKGQLFFGPLADVERPGESFSFSPLYRRSRYCASCHEGVVFGVPVYTTYSEWLASPARRQGKQCQDCHMAPTGRMTNIAPSKGGIERDPGTLASHRFPGGGPEMLRRCLSVEVGWFPRPGGVVARVEVKANSVGHRVPTGFIDRNLVLAVEAFDRAGNRVPLRSGPTVPDLAGLRLKGKPGKLFAKRLTGRGGPGPVPFWRPHDRLVDTRLFPGRPDRTDFLFPRGAERVRVQLLYRRFWMEVAREKGWADTEITVVDRTWRR